MSVLSHGCFCVCVVEIKPARVACYFPPFLGLHLSKRACVRRAHYSEINEQNMSCLHHIVVGGNVEKFMQTLLLTLTCF